jgi:hypothetical protein
MLVLLFKGDVTRSDGISLSRRQQPRSDADAMEKLRIAATTWSIADGLSEG